MFFPESPTKRNEGTTEGTRRAISTGLYIKNLLSAEKSQQIKTVTRVLNVYCYNVVN